MIWSTAPIPVTHRFALREMPPAAGWALSGAMSVVCVVVLLMHSADCSMHSLTAEQRASPAGTTPFLKSFSVEHCFLGKTLYWKDANQSSKGSSNSWALLTQLLLYHSWLVAPSKIHNTQYLSKNHYLIIKKERSQCVTGTFISICCNWFLFPV